jgi:hypothetical protein
MKEALFILLFASLYLNAFHTKAAISDAQAPPAKNRIWQDAQVDIKLRNYWKYLKEDEAQPVKVHNAWGQAVTLDFQSGYLWDRVGFDATYTGAIKLGASD